MALLEDAPFGDITGRYAVPNVDVAAAIVAREGGILASDPLFEALGRLFPSLAIVRKMEDGDRFREGDTVAELRGRARDVLLVERTLLNLLGRMCGIATLTAEFVKRADGVPIYDTRKTSPLLRYYDKYAVRVGGGYNHRFSLSDVGMIKDNHKRIAGSLRRAVLSFRENAPHTPLVVEVDTYEELLSLEGLPIDWVLLDNMDPETLRKAIPTARRMGFRVEVSGGITLENLPEYAALRPDRISIGAVTKAAKPVDLSLEVLDTLPLSGL